MNNMSKTPLVFQALSWHAEDIEVEDDSPSPTNNQGVSPPFYNYFIKIFGRTMDGRSVSVTVTGYQPEFYVKLPIKTFEKKEMITKVKSLLLKTGGYRDYNASLTHAKDFWGFTNNLEQDFIKVTCKSLRFFKAASGALSRAPFRPTLYESNIEPHLKFIHMRQIQPCGWIKLSRYVSSTDLLEAASSSLDVEAIFSSVKPHVCDDTAPFIVASFDIECTSTGGEFPVPVKSYRLMASQLVDLWTNMEKRGMSDYNKKTALMAALKDAFDWSCEDKDRPMDRISRVETKTPCNLDVLYEKIQVGIDDIVTAVLSKTGSGGGVAKRDTCVANVAKTLMQRLKFPDLSGDRIIQIGTTFHTYGSRECYHKHIITLGTCEAIDRVEIVECNTEAEVLIKWVDMMRRLDPDIVTGYNIFGFDFDYMVNRARELEIFNKFMQLSRFKDKMSVFKEQKLSSSALGDNLLRYIHMEGRVLIDLMKVVQRDHKLDSYKLDNVAHHFMGMNKNDVSPQEIFALQKGTAADRARVAAYCVQDCALCNHLVMKLEIIANNMGMSNVCLVPMEYIFMRGQGIKIFSLVTKECNANGFRIPVARKEMSVRREDIDHHIKDPAMADKVEERIKMMTKAIRHVPEIDQHRPFTMSAALIAKAAAKEAGIHLDFKSLCDTCTWLKSTEYHAALKDLGTALRVGQNDQECNVDTDGYEGAIVLEPKQGIYTQDPVAVLDFASLYPSCMCSENLCPSKAVLDPKYDNLPDVKYLDIEYDLFDENKVKVGVRKCRFVEGERGVIPCILMKLLAARKSTRKRMTLVTHIASGMVGYYKKDEQLFVPEAATAGTTGTSHEPISCTKDEIQPTFNEFQVAVLDGLQNAYKVTANSLYGQFGAKTSQIYFKDIAACTTATGRKMIMMAKEFLETRYGADVVYGDTDSVFVTFPSIQATGHAKIAPSIAMATEASNEFRKLIKAPHDLEYEKTFWPFILLSKKRYVGNLYEFDDKKYKQKSMGIVLRRRDNAQIVKKVYGGVIDIILSKQDVVASVEFLNSELDNLVKGRLPMDELVITKSLRGDYKDPTRIAHKVLADRIAERDPGNKPQSNDRIPYVYVTTPPPAKGEKMLQGEKIETPTFIRENGLAPDYAFYITNQIMKPVIQLYALVIEQLPGYCQPAGSFNKIRTEMMRDLDGNLEKVKDKMQTLREMIAKEILFDPVISRVNNATVRQSMVAKKYGGAAPLPPIAMSDEPPAKKPRAPRKTPPKEGDRTKPKTPRKKTIATAVTMDV